MAKKAKTIEVEVRGTLARNEFLRVKKFLTTNGKFKLKKERVLIDYSTFIKGQKLNARNKDIRLRVTNGVPEIIVKLGSWGSKESREEISVCTPNNSFDDLVRIFGSIGLEKGMLCVRNSWVYEYKGVELALVEVPNHSYYFEAEIMSHSDEVAVAQKKLDEVVKGLDLSVWDASQFFAYIKTLNKEVNIVFDFRKYHVGDFSRRFKI